MDETPGYPSRPVFMANERHTIEWTFVDDELPQVAGAYKCLTELGNIVLSYFSEVGYFVYDIDMLPQDHIVAWEKEEGTNNEKENEYC